jgi:hypothetical protein
MLFIAKTLLYMKKQILLLSFIVLILFVFSSQELAAQCPMCKLSAESNLRDGGTAGKGLNAGILYMFAMPYLLVGTLGFLWYRNRKNYDQEVK